MAGDEVLADEADWQKDKDDEKDGVDIELEHETQDSHEKIEGEQDVSNSMMREAIVKQHMVDMGAVGIKGRFFTKDPHGEHTQRIK